MVTSSKTPELSPAKILELGLGFWGPKTLLSAIELDVFTELAKQPLTCKQLEQRLGMHSRSARDFLDTLVSLGMLQRDGETYSNTPETDFFLDRNKPSYAGGMLEMANARLYPFWGSLTEALRTGLPQNEIRRGENLFEALYSDPARLRLFLQGMTGLSMGTARAIAAKFPWKDYGSFADIGCAQGCLPVQVALAHSDIRVTGFDLPMVGPVFEEYVAANGLSSRVNFQAGDFYRDVLPTADVLVFGHILHDWSLADKRMLLKKAYQALPSGGAVIVYESLIDDERRSNTFGLLMSLNMLIETTEGFDYTGADCREWMHDTGFRQTRVEHLVGPHSMVVGTK